MTDELDKAIDEVCKHFQAAWDAFLAGEGKRPTLEEHLQQVAAGKEKSFALLLKFEIEKRLGAGEEPNSEEYSKQFPVMKKVVEELLPSDAGAQRRANYGNEDPPTLDLINTLAVAYRVAEDPNKALPLFKEPYGVTPCYLSIAPQYTKTCLA